MEPIFVTAKQAAYMLGITPQNLARMRYLRKGPSFYKIGRSAMYKKAEVIEWLECRRVETEIGE